MPVYRAKWSNTKVYRPNGMKYADGECMWPILLSTIKRLGNPTLIGFAPDAAMKNAVVAFAKEFGRIPDLEKMVFEITCSAFGVKARVMEIDSDETG